MSSNSLIVKISHGTDMRRFTIDNFNTLNWEMLGKRVADAFGPFKSSFKLTYVDDEGDQITVSNDEELVEAVGLARKATPPVLRLAVGGKKDKKEAPDEQPAKDKTTKDTEAPTKTSVLAALPELAPFLEMLVEQMPAAMAAMPEALRTMLPHLELDVGATIAANAQAEAAKDAMGGAGGRCPWMAAQRAGGDPFCPPKPHGAQAQPGVHVGVTCDVSGMCPIVGNRYHLVGSGSCWAQAPWAQDSEPLIVALRINNHAGTAQAPRTQVVDIAAAAQREQAIVLAILVHQLLRIGQDLVLGEEHFHLQLGEDGLLRLHHDDELEAAVATEQGDERGPQVPAIAFERLPGLDPPKNEVSRADGCPTERDEQLVRSTHLRDALGEAAKVLRAIHVPHRRLGLEIIVLKKEPVFIQQLTVLAVEGRIAHFAGFIEGDPVPKLQVVLAGA